MKKSGWTLLGFVLVGGLLGRVLGEILKEFPPAGLIHTIFAESISTGISQTVDMSFITVKLEVLPKLNLLTLLGMVFGYYLHKNL